MKSVERIGGVSLLILALAAPLAGQVVTTPSSACYGNPYAAQPDPNAAKTELQRYYDAETQVKQQEIQANTDYTNDKLRCKPLVGAPANACLKQAGRNLQRAQANIIINRNNNNNTHTKVLIDIESVKDECNVKGISPAELKENMRHYRAQTDLKKQRVDVETKYANAKAMRLRAQRDSGLR